MKLPDIQGILLTRKLQAGSFVPAVHTTKRQSDREGALRPDPGSVWLWVAVFSSYTTVHNCSSFQRTEECICCPVKTRRKYTHRHSHQLFAAFKLWVEQHHLLPWENAVFLCTCCLWQVCPNGLMYTPSELEGGTKVLTSDRDIPLSPSDNCRCRLKANAETLKKQHQ